MRVFDLHCDSLYELYKRQLKFDNTELHISKTGVEAYREYRQVCAIWSEHRLSEEAAWEQFQGILAYQKTLRFPENFRCYLAVEGGKLLAGKQERLELLHDAGVKILTPVWQDECCMGGAWNTNAGLTPFGKQAILECFRLGILPDLSHCSLRMTKELLELAGTLGKPLLASHSNAYRVYPHPRNLRDEDFRTLLQCGSVVGISLAPQHLCPEDHPCTLDTLLLHIEHDLSLGGEQSVCLGCDFDGIEKTPQGIRGCKDLFRLAEGMARIGYSDTLIDGIFYQNAASFFERSGVL